MQNNSPLAGIWKKIDSAAAQNRDAHDLWEWLKEQTDFARFKPQPVSEIEVQKLTSAKGEEYYMLKNPQESTYLKLPSKDFYLWSLMDGTRSVKELVVAYFTKFGAFAFDRVENLIGQLKQKRFLDGKQVELFQHIESELSKQSLGHKANLFWKSFLHRQFTVRGLDRFFTKTYKAGIWILFTKPFKIFSLLISLVGIFLFISQLHAGYSILKTNDSYTLGLLTMLGINILAICIHEGAHAYATKSYGRHVDRGGVMIYFGMPAFFADTTDIWMAERKARIAVSWAGPYSQIVLGGICAILVFLFPGSPVNPFLFKFTFLAYLSVFLNLNPLLELDGYFMLIDWLEIPMLRKRALTFVKQNLWAKLRQRDTFSKEEKIFTIFGLLAAFWSVCAVFIAIYFWQLRISDIVKPIWLKSGWFIRMLLVLVMVAVLLPIVFMLAVRLYMFLKRPFSWLTKFFFLSGSRNAAFAALGFSIIATFTYHTLPESSSQDYAQHYATIIRLSTLVFALFLVTRNVTHYRESQFERIFQLLTLFLSFLLLGIILRTVREFTGGEVLNNIALLFELVGYASLFASAFLLFAKEDISLCTVTEKGIIAIMLSTSFLAIVPIAEWSITIGSSLLYVAMTSSLPFFGILTVAFLIPVLFTSYKTEFWVSWLLIAASLVGMTVANVFNLFTDMHYTREAGIRSIANKTSISFSILSYALLAFALYIHHLVYTQVRFTREKTTSIEGSDETAKLKNAFANILGAILGQFTLVYGKRLAKKTEDRLNSFSLAAGWDVTSVYGRVTDNTPTDLNINVLAAIYRGALEQALNMISDITGKRFVDRALSRGYDQLYWEERETAEEYLLRFLEWGGRLTEEFERIKQNYQSILGQMPILAGLNSDDIFMIASQLRMEKHRAGTFLIRQGEIGDKFYIIREGEVEVLLKDDNGAERTVVQLKKGDCFGEIALLKEIPRTASCKAATPVELLVLTKADFNQLVKQQFEISSEIQKSISKVGMIKAMPLFKELSPRHINLLSAKLKEETFVPETVIARQDEPGDAFYIVKSGTAALTVKSEKEEEQVIAYLDEGEFFGEMALLTGLPNMGTLKTVSETELLILEKEDFDELAKEHFFTSISLKNA
jgi:putative peptide zinc metalloprotease protein